MPKKFAEFFAGAGLVRLGLEKAGWECVFANDHDNKKAAIYEANFSGDHYRVCDVHKLEPSDVPQVDLATASFPCTDLSLAGKRKGLAGKQSGAFYGFTNLLKKMGAKPKLLLLENVPGLLTANGGRDIVTTLKTLNSLGYEVDLFAMDARWFTPQSRQRLFILGRKTNDKNHGSRLFEERNNRMKPKSLASVVDSAKGVRWGFVKIPSPPDETPQRLREIVEKNSTVKWWDNEKVEALLARMSDKNRAKFDYAIKSRGLSYIAAYQRVRDGQVRVEPRFDGLSGCLRTPRGGSSRQILFVAGGGKTKARFFTARECGRLQGAPDSFRIPEKQNAGLFAFGDAVCAPLVEWIGNNVLNPLSN